VTGPSLTNSTDIIAPKIPVATVIPNFAQSFAVKCKLRDDQRATMHIYQEAVHLPLIVLKDPQVCDLLGHIGGDSGGIVAANAKQNHEACRDFSHDATLHGNARAAYTLGNSSHFSAQKLSCYWCGFIRFRGTIAVVPARDR
jgi:hypothetical protein